MNLKDKTHLLTKISKRHKSWSFRNEYKPHKFPPFIVILTKSNTLFAYLKQYFYGEQL